MLPVWLLATPPQSQIPPLYTLPPQPPPSTRFTLYYTLQLVIFPFRPLFGELHTLHICHTSCKLSSRNIFNIFRYGCVLVLMQEKSMAVGDVAIVLFNTGIRLYHWDCIFAVSSCSICATVFHSLMTDV